MSKQQPDSLTDDQLDDAVEQVKGHLAPKGAARGVDDSAAAECPFPDHAIRAALAIPARPPGMGLADWIKIVQAIFAAIGPFLPHGPAPSA